MSSLKYWIWLASVSGVSAESAGRLIERFETPEKVFFAQPEEYREMGVLKKNELRGLQNKDLKRANEILGKCAENRYRTITMQDSEYPDRLRNIYAPPVVLYVRGRFPVIDEEAAVGIVGTRKCTAYGVKEAERLGYELAKYGMVVVSGLARGIDSAAALGALRGGGHVVGVLGCGLDVIYPPENKQLYEDVGFYGSIISEYPPGTSAYGYNFPQRNRIISGISLGVAVIEAPRNSGALITASRALEQGRDVFAMPANVDSPASTGSNRLLREGAIPLITATDIAEEYVELYPDKIKNVDYNNLVYLDTKSHERINRKYVKNDKKRQEEQKKEIDNATEVEYIDLDKLLEELSGEEKIVAHAIGRRNMHVDEIIELSGLTASKVLSALTMLEVSGYAKETGAKYFELTDPKKETEK